MIDDAVFAELANIVGEPNLLREGPRLASYESGARNDLGRTAFVVRPSTTAQVSNVMRTAVRAGIPLIPQSGNTGLVGGSIPDMSASQAVLSLDRLTFPPEIDAVNRSVTVGAGTRLSALNDALAADGLFFPIDLGADPMVGGMVATNTGGARFIRYGDVRRNTLGLQVVLADQQGTVLDLGSDLRKNNTGIDLKHLFIGTSGSWGIITKAVLEVHRKPQQFATALLVPRDDDAIVELLLAFEEAAGDLLTAFEGMSREAMRSALDHVASLRNPFPRGELPDFVILVELARTSMPRAGEEPLETLLEGILGSLWERKNAPLADAIMGRPEGLWHMRHALSEGAKAAGHLIAFDLAFARADLPRFRKKMRAWVSAHYPHIRICDFGHIGDGGLHFNLVYRDLDGLKPPSAFVEEFRDTILREVVLEFGGSFSAEHAIGRLNQRYYDQFTAPTITKLADGLASILVDKPIGAARFGQVA